MSIKDLFSRKTVAIKGTDSGSVDAESHRFILRKAEQDETFVPPVDFATASNFIRFGSAEEYYESSVRRVYSSYPYDGSEAEKILYSLSSSYYDRYILDELYPKSTGYAILNPTGYGASSKTSGYGLNASSDDYEYIFIGGGVRVAAENQHDPNLDRADTPLYKKFQYGTEYVEGTDKATVFAFSSVSGSTIEFWMKKNSFDTAKTEKEVILDLWNGELSSSSRYGRITLELFGTGTDPFRLTYQNGTVGVFQQSLHSFSPSDVADGNWHHWAVSTVSKYENLTNYLELKLYKDGIVVNEQSIATTTPAGVDTPIGNISGRMNGQIGALLSSPSSSLGALSQDQLKYAGKLSASLDEVRFWKRRVGSREIYNNWYHPIGGGANTDENRESLGLYFKFNEGITLTSSIDSVVLDYSGRVANGNWTGYSTESRNTGSCFVSASVLAIEPEDPIIRYNHGSVKTLISNLKLSGSTYDVQNTSYMYDMVPFWMREEDHEIGDNNLRKVYQVLASYFDTLYLQIQSLPDIKSKQYFQMDKKPYPFAKELLQHNGLIVPDLFIDQGVLEKFSDRDDQNLKYENTMHDLKSRIYYNIYNNLKTIYESKGTEKSYRNMLRCFGIDDELVKLNLYTDNGINYLTDKVKYSSHKTKFINHNNVFNFVGRVFNTSSADNPKTFISGSGPLGSRREKNLAFTLESDIIVPEKIDVGFEGFFPTDFITSSVMGFHSASADDPSNYAWYGSDESNLQVHLVRPVNESKNAKFVLTNNAKTIFAESETFENIYDNQRWSLALRVYPDGYPFIGTVATASNPTYKAELYGVTHNLGDVKEEFTITANLNYAQGSAMLANTKRFYAGCEATNFTGLPLHYSDLKIAACRLWYDKLDDLVIKQHNLDASNYGHNKIHGNPSPYISGLDNVHVPSSEALAFNWDFQQITSSDSGGNFIVEDFSSGTSASRYGWIDDLILRENRGRGYGYQASSNSMIDNEFIFSAKKELPEISFTSDGVFIKGDEEIFFSEDEDTTDNVFMFEKSMYQVISEEVFKTFSTVVEYSNLFMKPVDHYREEYKRLDHFKELYFQRVQNDLDFEKFTYYFRFIDSTISTFIQQLHPAMAKFNEGISDIIESHILERPKYKRQFPFVHTKDTIPDGKMAGIRERIYNWKEGHAPNYKQNFDENDNCFWQKERAEKPANAIVPEHGRLEELRQVIVSEADGKAKNLGTSDREIYQGSTYAVRSFSKQYRLTYDEQATIHGGTNYSHQKNRDFILDHLKPHGAVGTNNVPQEVITIGVGSGLGIVDIEDCDKDLHIYSTDEYSVKHLQKREWNYFGVVGRYADGTGDQPKSDEVEQLYKVHGHRNFPFTLVSGTIDTGYNKKINDDYDTHVVLTNLHSDTTSPSNDIPMQGPFAETWVGGRQFRHIPMNRHDATLVSSGGVGTVNQLDDQYTRPEGYRLLVGDHPSEPVKDGAMGFVGPDYGGPYPDTSRQMATHYREERAKRPFNIKNIRYSTSSVLLGNYQENYEIISAGGRSINNKRFVEFAEHSSSLTSPIGAILPMTTNQATLFGSTPFLSGNVFGGLSNLTADTERVQRYERLGTFASGAFLYNDDKHVYGGTRAEGLVIISGSTILSYDTGSFVASGSAQPGANSVGEFRLLYPIYSTSTGELTFTGSTTQGTKSIGEVTVGPMPDLSFSTGSFSVTTATTFGTPSVGSLSIGAMPVLSTSSGSFEITGAYIAPTTAVNGAFTAANKTTYATQYTGSFELQTAPAAPKRGYRAFTARGTTMVDGHHCTLILGGTSKKIEADTSNAASSGSDITMALKSVTASDNKKALSGTDDGTTRARIFSDGGTLLSSVSSQDFAISFWFYYNDTGSNTFLRSYAGTSFANIRHQIDLDSTIAVKYNDGTTSSTKSFTSGNTGMSTGNWYHLHINMDLGAGGEPSLYVNGDLKTGTGFTAFAGSQTAISNLLIELDDGNGMHDLVIWDRLLTASEISESYNDGVFVNYSSHSATADISSWFRLGEETAFNSFNNGDTLSGTIQFGDSIGSEDVYLQTEAQFTMIQHAMNVVTNKTNVQIWDQLKSDLNSAFTGWTADYIAGPTLATFFVHKDVYGSSGGSASISTSGTSFQPVSGQSGVNGIASTLKNGDNITIEGDQFDVYTTNSGSSYPHINLANAYRKAIEIAGTDPALYNEAWHYDWSGGTTNAVTFSLWFQAPNDTSQNFLFRASNSSNSISARMYTNNNDLGFWADYGSHVNAFTVQNLFSSHDPDEWIHVVWVLYKNNQTQSKVYVNGQLQSLTGWSTNSSETYGNFDRIYVGNYSLTHTLEADTAMQDLVIWNTALDTEDANTLFNSGSWFDPRASVKAPKINDWWMLGESRILGNNLGGGAPPIAPTLGTSSLYIDEGNSMTIVNGTAKAYTNDPTNFNNFKTLIAANTLYEENSPGQSTISYTTSGNTATFTLTDTLSVAPTAFSKNGTGFSNLSGPNANGDDTNVPTGGALEGRYVQVGSVKFYADTDGNNSGTSSPFYAQVSGDYHIYSNAPTNNDWWARIAAAVNAGVTTHTTTHAGSGVFDVDADSPGTAGNITISTAGGGAPSGFSSPTNVQGGTAAISTADGRGFAFSQTPATGSDNLRIYISSNLTTRLSGLGGTTSFIQDGVWLNVDGGVDRYYISSTGSSAGSSGISPLMWQRVTASLVHGINDMTDAPAVTSSPNNSFNIVDLGNGSARIEFTGSYTLSDGHNFELLKTDISATGDQAFTVLDSSVNGYGHPGTAHVTNSGFSVNSVGFSFVYPYNNYAGSDILLRPTGSKSELISHMNSLLEANVPNFDFGIEGDLIGLTGSVTGSLLNNKIFDNALLISNINQTAGGTDEQGVGHGKGITITRLDTSTSKNIYSVQTLASGSGALIANGVMKDGNNYFVSSTGSTGVKTNGVNAHYWERLKDAFEDATLQLSNPSGNSGLYYISGSATRADIYFTGSFGTSAKHDFEFSQAAHMANDVGFESFLYTQGRSKGYGKPVNSSFYTSNGNYLTIDGVSFENVYPYNNYAKIGAGSNIPIRHTGSKTDYVEMLSGLMAANLTDFESFSVTGDDIFFRAKNEGSANNETLTNLFHGMTTTNIVGGANSLGVSNGHQVNVSLNGGTTSLIASSDLRNESAANTFVEDGVWKNSGTGHYYISSTGSAVSSNGVQTEWVRRVTNSLARIVQDRSGTALQSFAVVSGSSPNYAHIVRPVGALTASNAHDIVFTEPAGNNFMASSINLTGYGFLKFGGVVTAAKQTLTFDNGGSPITFEFTVPHNNYNAGGLGSNIGIRATGSFDSFFNRVSSSIQSTLSNKYTITSIASNPSVNKVFSMRASQVGSSYNGDLLVGGQLVDNITQMNSGHLPYNQFDDKFILLSHATSKNHLFVLDHDGVQHPITNKNHSFVATVKGGVFALNGELVTGSTYVSATNATGYGKQQPDLILVRGSTYRFNQGHDTNHPGAVVTGHHPLVFHTSPLTASGAGTLVTSSWAQNDETPVRYFNDGTEVNYTTYASNLDGNGSDYIVLSCSATTPERLFYGCGNHPNMGGTIYVISASNRSFVDSTGTNTQVWDRLSSSMNTQFPRLNITYSDAQANDQTALATTSEDYLPSVARALFKITGSSNTDSSLDRTFIIASGSSWSDIHQVTGSTTYGGFGVQPGAALSLNWGQHPDTANFRSLTFGVLGFNNEDPFSGFVASADRLQRNVGRPFTGSALPATIATDSAYYISSSAMWTAIEEAIENTGQFAVQKTVDSENKWIQFRIRANYYSTRFNFTGSDAPVGSVGLSTGSVNGGFNITQNIAGGVNPTGNDGLTATTVPNYFEFQRGSGETVRIRGDFTGWRDRAGDPAKTIYYDLHSTAGNNADRRAQIRSNLSGAWASLTSSNGVPYYQLIGGIVTHNPVTDIYNKLVASVTGSEFNFVTPAAFGPSIGGGHLFRSGSQATLPAGYEHGSHFVTGALDSISRINYATRTNVNQREQAVLSDGSRQKTVITSRFYGGGGPEAMTEAFLDVYAKEKSVYSALPFRNLHVKNDSGEVERNVHSISEDYAVETIETLPASLLRVNSHADRREGLNTLHTRHAGRAGLDSTHGVMAASDFTEPSQGGTYEPSFHKVHRNAKVVPRLVADSDTAAVLVKKHNNFYLQTQIPASDYHYSWVTSSLGDNYSVSSGRQKVFGYWPKDGILIRNNKKGEAGSYYATQITASTVETAIVFPTGSDIHGS